MLIVSYVSSRIIICCQSFTVLYFFICFFFTQNTYPGIFSASLALYDGNPPVTVTRSLMYIWANGWTKSGAIGSLIHPCDATVMDMMWNTMVPMTGFYHDDVIKWRHFPRYWPFVRGIHRSPVNSSHKGQWRGALMFSLIYADLNGWVNSREAGDLSRNRAHCDVTVMMFRCECSVHPHKNAPLARCFAVVCGGLVLVDLAPTSISMAVSHGPLTRYVKLWVAHAPGVSATFYPPPPSKETTS